MSVLADVIDKKGVMPPSDLPLPKGVVLVASVEDVRVAFKEKYTATEEGTDAQIETRLRTRWSRATKAMIKFSIIGSQKPWLWFTGKEVQGMRIRGVNKVENTYEEGDSGISDDDVSDLIGQ